MTNERIPSEIEKQLTPAVKRHVLAVFEQFAERIAELEKQGLLLSNKPPKAHDQ